MPTTEIITIINNSGKVISTGKQLVNIFKEAQAAYRDRKDAAKAHRRSIQRANTFDVASRSDPYYDEYYYGRYPEYIHHAYDRRSLRDAFSRRRSYDDDDGRSHALSRYSRQSRRPHRPQSSERPLPALTEGNLKTHSEVSGSSPSKAYRSPYAETAPRDMQLSRPTLALGAPPPASESAGPVASGALVPGPGPNLQKLVQRPRSDPSLAKKKSIDMDLAYGNIPPDLAFRVDLDPNAGSPEQQQQDPQEAQALTLMDRIESFLEEAQCVHHTASTMIEHLQRNPEAAAAVALSLAELSTLIGKMSPAFLGFLKGGSPAVFALLASPQFLIGTSIAVGVTVVMFGGWKIVKRIAAAKTLEAPFEMRAAGVVSEAPAAEKVAALPHAAAGATSAASYDEALVLREVEELSSIETWRRGIVPFGGDEDRESADVELMSREAERALRERFNRDLDEVEPCDSVSQVSRARTERSKKSYRSHRSGASRRHHHSHRDHREENGEIPERKSSAGSSSSKKDRDGGKSEAASQKSHRSHRSSRSRGHHHHHHEGSSAVSRSSSKHTARIDLKAIEEGDGGGDESSSGSGTGKPKEKKRDMIKQLFKMKKDKEDRENAVSVLV
ncbi:hypothetical protein N657DRAFT_684747 [Parathielavia appendiculata]|uniref:Uncharacterized protein n=1 Tax=Parathielavia appendiculata TaxID=2587402 RepID=A0AAN6TRZ5_9PEZI|nr:hypothetical protein N657DRAFT_684747 [Parathielavia appendiculata]